MSFIDERIVQMKFDNKQFESGAKESIKTLDELDAKSQFDGSVKGLDRLKSVIGAFNFNPMTGALEVVTNKFSSLEYMALGSLQRIGDKITSTGSQLLKAFTFDNVGAGWKKFSDKTGSVATLVSQGNSLELVNDQLEKLNWFTDETSYNFVDMVSNIGKFTATGVKLDDAVNAMEGIATWTALSGQDAATASRAMYQLSQAMGAGVMRREDYRSIQNASMDTEEFRQKALDAGVALGTLRKESDGTYTSIVKGAKQSNFKISQFAENLTNERWFTKDVMMEVFGTYSSAVDELYKAVESGQYSTASEAIEAMGGDLDAFGLKAFKAAQEARSWKDVVDSVQDAVSTGWMTTFELIFGNYEEAKKLWTDLANELYDVFAEGGNARNEMLKEWKELGGRKDLLDAFWNTWNGIRNILDLVSESFRELFPATTAEQLADFTKKLKELSETFLGLFKDDRTNKDKNAIRKSMELAGYSAEEIDKELNGVTNRVEAFQNTFKGLFAVLDIVVQAFKAVGKGASTLLSYILPAGDGLLGFTGSIGEWLVNLDKYIKENDVFGKAIEKLGPIFETVGTGISKFAEIAKTAFKAIWDFVKPLLQSFGLFKENGDETSEAMDKVADGAEKVAEKVSPLTAVFQFFSKVFERIKELFSAAAPLFQAIGSALGKLWDGIHETLVNGLQNINTDNLSELFKGGLLAGVIIAIKKFVSNIKDSVPDLAELKEKVVDLLDGVGGAIDAWKNNQLADMFLKIGIAIGILAASLFVLSTVDQQKLYSAAGVLVVMAGALAMLMGALSKLLGITKSTDNVEKDGGIVGKATGIISGVSGASGTADMLKTSGAIVAISVAVMILAGAVMMLSNLEWDALLRGMIGVGSLIAMLIGTAYILSKIQGSVVKGAGGLILFAIAIDVLTHAVKILASIDVDTLWFGVGALGGVLLELMAFLRFSKSMKVGTGVGLVLLAASVQILCDAIKKFGEMDANKLNQGSGAIFSILATIALFTRAVKTDGILKMSVAMAIMAASMKIFGSVMASMGSLDDETFGKGLSGIAMGLMAFAVAANTLKGSLGAAASMVIMSVALIGLATAFKIIATISIEDIVKSLFALGLGLLMIVATTKAIAPFVTAILALGAAFVLFGIGALAIGAGIMSMSLGFTALMTAIATSLPIIIEGLGALVNAFLDAVITAGPKIGEAIGVIVLGVLEALASYAQPIIGAIVKLIVDVLNGIAGLIGPILTALFNVLLAILNGLATMIRDGAPLIFDAIINILDAIWDMLVEFVAIICEKVPFIGSDVADGIRGSKDWVIGAMQETAEEAANAYADTANETLDGRNPDIVSTLKDTVINSDAQNTWGTFGSENSEEYISQFTNGDWDLIPETLTETLDQSATAWTDSGVASEAFNFGGQMPQDVAAGISENSDAPVASIDEMVQKAEDALNRLPENASRIGGEFPSKVKSGIDSKASLPKTAASNLKRSVESNMRVSGSYSIGAAVPQGMARGMSANAYLVRSEAERLSNMIPDTIKKLLNINSPSKVIAAITESVPEGAALGIKRSMHFVHSSVSGMGNVIIDELSTAIADVSDVVENDLDVNPTITPVLDLESLRNGIAFANNSLSGINVRARSMGFIDEVSSNANNVGSMIQDALNGAMADISNNVYGRLNENTNYTIEVPVVLDGHEVARVTAPYTKSEIAKIDRNSARRGGNL